MVLAVDSLNKALSLFERLKDYKNSKELADHSRARIQQLNEEEKRKDIVLLIEELERERDSLLIELNDLHGLFTGKRRKEIEARLAEIERSILIHF